MLKVQINKLIKQANALSSALKTCENLEKIHDNMSMEVEQALFVCLENRAIDKEGSFKNIELNIDTNNIEDFHLIRSIYLFLKYQEICGEALDKYYEVKKEYLTISYNLETALNEENDLKQDQRDKLLKDAKEYFTVVYKNFNIKDFLRSLEKFGKIFNVSDLSIIDDYYQHKSQYEAVIDDIREEY